MTNFGDFYVYKAIEQQVNKSTDFFSIILFYHKDLIIDNRHIVHDHTTNIVVIIILVHYSIPSPLHFNEDNTPDFLIRFNKGKWMNYDYSYMGVLDGNNGELLWMMNCSMGAMASAVTVKSSRKGHDGMLFFASGCKQEMNRMKKDTKEKRVFQQVDEENMCPQAHLGLEQAICNIRERSRRHGDKDESEDENYIQVMVDNYGNPIDIAGGDGPPDYDTDSFQVFRPQDVDFSLLKDYIPSDLWVALDGMDHFPDPWTDTRTFVQDYCEIPYDTLTSRVYYLTPNMIKLGIIKPLYVHRPFVYSKLNKRLCIDIIFLN